MLSAQRLLLQLEECIEPRWSKAQQMASFSFTQLLLHSEPYCKPKWCTAGEQWRTKPIEVEGTKYVRLGAAG